MLATRIATALVLLPLVLWLLFAADARQFTVSLSLVFTLAAWEWSRLMGLTKPFGRFSLVIFFQIIMLFIIWLKPELEFWPGDARGHVLEHGANIQNLPMLLIIIGVVWWLLNLFNLLLSFQNWLQSGNLLWARALAGLLILIPCWAALISIHAESLRNNGSGDWLLLFIFLQIWAADIGAFFAGKTFGKTPLAPKVSPKKTWEGVFGGSFLAIIIAYFTAKPFGLETITLTQIILLSLSINVFSVVGDLTESIYKRQQGVKDSSHLLPGHGGILDRIDSITSALPWFALVYFWLL